MSRHTCVVTGIFNGKSGVSTVTDKVSIVKVCRHLRLRRKHNRTAQFAALALTGLRIMASIDDLAGKNAKRIKQIRRGLSMVVFFCKMYGIIKNKANPR
jgi:IS30 family transposase